MVQFKLILKKNIQRSTGNRNGTEEKGDTFRCQIILVIKSLQNMQVKCSA